jgi:hypothetical protein
MPLLIFVAAETGASKITSPSAAIPAFGQCLPSGCLANGHITSLYIYQKGNSRIEEKFNYTGTRLEAGLKKSISLLVLQHGLSKSSVHVGSAQVAEVTVLKTTVVHSLSPPDCGAIIQYSNWFQE